MNKNVIYFVLLVSFFASCQENFDSDTWILNNSISSKNNVRKTMVDDLISKYLKKNMLKKEVIFLLGKPTKDTLSFLLPKNIKIPDSLIIIDYNSKSNDSLNKSIDKLNYWYKNNYIKVDLMTYFIGWEFVDPIYLEIIISKDNKVKDFWIRED